MKKQYTSITLSIFYLIQFISTQNLQAQSCWAPVGGGTGTAVGNTYVQAIATYNGNLIMAGNFSDAGAVPVSNIAQWNGLIWSPLGSGISIDTARYAYPFISSLAVYNGELYAAGGFDTAGGVPVHNIAKWNGSTWSAVGSGTSGGVWTLAVYNGALYAGGTIDSAGGVPVSYIAKWNGTQWSDVDSGVGASSTVVAYLAVYNGKLYAGGTFGSAGRVQARNIAVWNDTAWSALGSGLGGYGAIVESIADYQGMVYATVFHYTDSIAVWDGSTWTMIAGVTHPMSNVGIDVLCVFDTTLIAGGAFDTIGGISSNGLAQWNGTAWSDFGGGGRGFHVDALNTYNGNLYAGGYFTFAGSTYATNIAEYTCATDGISNIKTSANVTVYPNPTTGKLTIFTENINEGSSVEVYDLMGKRIYKSGIRSTTTEINLNDRAPGVYLYRISQENGALISTGTIVIQ